MKLAHLQSDRKPTDRRLTDLSKLNSALAARLGKPRAFRV